MKPKAIFAIASIVLTIVVLTPTLISVKGSAATPNLRSQETIIRAPDFDGTTFLVQTDGLGEYQAINKTDGTIIFSSANASYTINSLINDDSHIVLGAGIFALTNTITKQANNVSIEGQGTNTVLLISNSAISAFTVSGVNGWSIRNLQINDALRNRTSGIYATKSQNILIENCEISNTYYNGITTLYSSNITIDNNSINAARYGFGIAVWNTTKSTITNNKVDLTYWSGITISDGSNYNVIRDNVVSRSGQMGTLGDGIEIGATLQSGGTVGNLVFNNTCHDNVVDGISVAQSNGTVVSGNIVFNNGAAGIGVESNSEETQIVGNSVFNNSAIFRDGAGIAVIDPLTRGTIISSNSVFGNCENGIFLFKNSTNTLVVSNVVYDNGQKSTGNYDGICIASSNNTINTNRCFDDQAVRTQRFGVNEERGYLNNVLNGNIFSQT
jgi:parallel beta-helix repeat protein